MKEQLETERVRRFEFYLMEGNSAHNAEEWDVALKNYRMALKENAKDYNLYSYIAAVYEARSEWTKVSESSKLAIALGTKYKADHLFLLNEYVRLGKAYYELHKPRDAWKAFLEAQLLAFNTSPVLPELEKIQEELNYKATVKISHVKELTLIKAHSKQFIQNKPLQIQLAQHKGRGLFATKDFKVGEVVFVEEPFIACPDYRNTEPNFCLSTLRPLYHPELLIESENTIFGEIPEGKKREVIDNMMEQLRIEQLRPVRCSGCGVVQFSSAGAERAARAGYLGSLCDGHCDQNPLLQLLLPSLFRPPLASPPSPPSSDGETLKLHMDISTMELLTLFLAKINKDLDLWDKFAKFLVSVEEQPLRPLTEIENKYLSALNKLFPELDFLLSEKQFLRLKSMINLNAFAIEASGLNLKLIDKSGKGEDAKGEAAKGDGDAAGRTLSTDAVLSLVPSGRVVCGAAMYQVASFMNHSCTPNCQASSPAVSAAHIFIATQPIKKGDELTCSYLSQDMDPYVRREMLAAQYGFYCQGTCEACVNVEEGEYEEGEEEEEEE
eukprot:TRINITY_DN2352_c0_g1_i1.p1 TRINITY_DN2352_c0_g1~~TRINITY_DN2352_c0_g1_i1.p1  ORF type:complete len:646 (+),score=132.76 TRINITY_DN2352_c0_g1_i1:282-1940(+)